MKASAILSTTSDLSPLPAPARRSADRFHLTGRSVVLDPRNNAVRRDLADVALADRLFAPHYARALPAVCGPVATAVRAAAADSAAAVSELLPGERFDVLETSGGWAWGYCGHDHYVGYVPDAALQAPGAPADHIVAVPVALVFAAADIKAPLLRRLPMGSRLSGTVGDGFLALTGGGFVHLRHLIPMTTPLADPVAVAGRLIGVPYLWGGRSGLGIDCSGLVQLAFGLCGLNLPRDSDQQRLLGAAIADGAPLLRGDLIFFPGHVGLMATPEHMIHANAYHMAVTVEPLAAVVARLAADHPAAIVAQRRVLA